MLSYGKGLPEIEISTWRNVIMCWLEEMGIETVMVTWEQAMGRASCLPHADILNADYA